jgi:hypothetical protein
MVNRLIKEQKMAHIKTYEDGSIALVDIWTIEDIFCLAEDNDMKITQLDAERCLIIASKATDANVGINWDTLLLALHQAITLNNKDLELSE